MNEVDGVVTEFPAENYENSDMLDRDLVVPVSPQVDRLSVPETDQAVSITTEKSALSLG